MVNIYYIFNMREYCRKFYFRESTKEEKLYILHLFTYIGEGKNIEGIYISKVGKDIYLKLLNPLNKSQPKHQNACGLEAKCT